MKIRAFELADRITRLVYQVTTGFPREEKVFQPSVFDLIT
jgi:hypothetical protein